MSRAWGAVVLALAGCYAVPAKHEVGDRLGEVDSGQDIDPAAGDLDASADPDAEPDAEPDLDASDEAREDAQPDTRPACTCADPEQPICIEATGRCVQCRETKDCAAGKHCLAATGQCVGCLDASHCAGKASASFCDPATNACTGCREGVDADCNNVPGLNVCQGRACVQCAGARRDACGEAAPACSASFSCEACKADSDCQRFGKVCDEGKRACVACTIDSEAAQCGNNSCNPATQACTGTDRGSVDLCGRCLADSECKADHRCISMNFQGASRGGFCMKRASNGGCSPPFGAAPIKRASLSGAAAEDYCGIAEAVTSCEAVLALLADRTCPAGQASQCGAEGAVCGNVNHLTPPRCTYVCETSIDCPANSPCPMSGTDKYCGKP
jgi:hypothetical protein